MASVLAIVSKAIFEKSAPAATPGQTLDMAYASANKALDVLGAGDALFLVTVRPGERLWLVAILESPKRVGDAWRAKNAAPVTDVTSVLPVLELEAGVGVTFKAGALGMTLQAPRRLAPAGANRLRGLAGKPAKVTAAAKPAKPKTSAKPAPPTKGKPVVGKLADLIRGLGIKGARCADEETVALDAYLWTCHAAAIAALGRVHHLQLWKAAGRDLEDALQRPELATMSSLSLVRNRILEPEAAAIAACPYLTKIESLDLTFASVSGKSLAHIVTAKMPKLRTLDLTGNKIAALGARAYAASPLAKQVTDLRDLTIRALVAAAKKDPNLAPVKPKARPVASPRSDARGSVLVEKLVSQFDEATRSVYLDWLLEHEDSRAELPQLEARWLAEPEANNAKLSRVVSRLAKEFGQRYRYKSAKLAYAHGLLVEVEGSAGFFIEQGAELLANEPIRSVVIDRATAKDWPKLAAIPAMQRVPWLSVGPDHVEAVLAAFPKSSVSLQVHRADRLDDLLALRGAERIRGMTLWFPSRDDVAQLAADRRLAKMTRVDFADYFSSAVVDEYRAEHDPLAVLELGWKLSWIGTRSVRPNHLAALRARVTDVVLRHD